MGKIADNYLSLKAYAQAAADSIADYVTKGKGKGLSSIGDLLESLSQTAGEAEPPAAPPSSPHSLAFLWRWTAPSPRSTVSSTSTSRPSVRSRTAGQWASATTSWPSSR